MLFRALSFSFSSIKLMNGTAQLGWGPDRTPWNSVHIYVPKRLSLRYTSLFGESALPPFSDWLQRCNECCETNLLHSCPEFYLLVGSFLWIPILNHHNLGSNQVYFYDFHLLEGLRRVYRISICLPLSMWAGKASHGRLNILTTFSNPFSRYSVSGL